MRLTREQSDRLWRKNNRLDVSSSGPEFIPILPLCRVGQKCPTNEEEFFRFNEENADHWDALEHKRRVENAERDGKESAEWRDTPNSYITKYEREAWWRGWRTVMANFINVATASNKKRDLEYCKAKMLAAENAGMI